MRHAPRDAVGQRPCHGSAVVRHTTGHGHGRQDTGQVTGHRPRSKATGRAAGHGSYAAVHNPYARILRSLALPNDLRDSPSRRPRPLSDPRAVAAAVGEVARFRDIRGPPMRPTRARFRLVMPAAPERPTQCQQSHPKDADKLFAGPPGRSPLRSVWAPNPKVAEQVLRQPRSGPNSADFGRCGPFGLPTFGRA